jgi:hypothetical protein
MFSVSLLHSLGVSMTSSTLFPTWREAWCQHEEIVTLFHDAETLLRRRSSGNHKYPVPPESVFARADHAVVAIRDWVHRHSPLAEPPEEAAKAIYDQAWPLLRAAAWPRWLLLERAFLDASNSGDLHFAALLLRTMCEEIDRQHLLDVDRSMFVSFAASTVLEERDRFAKILEGARSSIAPLTRAALDLPSGEDRSERPAGEVELDRVRASLNDYIHPNYGSQVAALYPERTTAAVVLLTAVVAVYRSFFALSWSGQKPRGSSRPVPVQHLSQSRAARDVVSRVLPAARGLLQELEIPSALDWLMQPHGAAMNVLGSPEATALLNTLPNPVKTADLRIAGDGSWSGTAPNALLNRALARRSEFLLTTEFPNGAPSVQETDRWFSFLSRAIELILLVNELKEALFKTQLVRQLAQGNALAIELCLRSLIEHRATVAALPERLTRKWIEAARRLQPGGSLPQSIEDIDNTIAKLLAGRRSSKEPLLPFATREDGKPILASISLPTLIADAFENSPAISKNYDLASAAIHGRIQRGKELLRDRSGSETAHARLMGLNVLDWICNISEQKKYWYPALQIMMSAKHAALQSCKVPSGDSRKTRQVMGEYEGTFKANKDYTGEGTKAAPILFRTHLLYYSATRHFLKQMNIQPTGPSVLDRDDQGCLCDRYTAPTRDWWFAIPNSCVELLLDGIDRENA